MKRDTLLSDPAVTLLSVPLLSGQAHRDDNEITGNQNCLSDTRAER